jgi:hypothetical protein
MTHGGGCDIGGLTDRPGFIAAKDWAAAERLLRKAARAKNPPPEVYYDLAKVLEAAGKPCQMAVWLKRALSANPLDVRQPYEKQLRDLQEAYGEAMLELRARKKLQALIEREDDN